MKAKFTKVSTRSPTCYTLRSVACETSSYPCFLAVDHKSYVITRGVTWSQESHDHEESHDHKESHDHERSHMITRGVTWSWGITWSQESHDHEESHDRKSHMITRWLAWSQLRYTDENQSLSFLDMPVDATNVLSSYFMTADMHRFVLIWLV